MTKKTSSVLLIFILLASLYLFMKITGLRLDLSSAGFWKEDTEKFKECLEDYRSKHPKVEGKISFADYDYCIGVVPKDERYKKVFYWPKIYFSKPK